MTNSLIIIIIGIAFFLLGLLLNRSREGRSYTTAILYGAIAAYLYFILVITILGRPSEGVMQARLVPLRSWLHVIFGINRWFYLKEIILNVLLFMPIGFLAGAIWKIKEWRGFLYGLGLSLIIELIQLVSCRGEFEWDDLLHNAIGCFIGVVIINCIKKAWSARNAV